MSDVGLSCEIAGGRVTSMGNECGDLCGYVSARWKDAWFGNLHWTWVGGDDRIKLSSLRGSGNLSYYTIRK